MNKETSAQAQTAIEKIADQIETLSVMQVCDLVKLLEDKFGVSAQAAAVAAAPVAAAAADAAVEEKTEFELMLKSFKDKIPTIKVVRVITGLGLKEAKEMVEKAPVALKTGISKEECDKFVKELVDAGCEAEAK